MCQNNSFILFILFALLSHGITCSFTLTNTYATYVCFHFLAFKVMPKKSIAVIFQALTNSTNSNTHRVAIILVYLCLFVTCKRNSLDIPFPFLCMCHNESYFLPSARARGVKLNQIGSHREISSAVSS